MKKKQLIFAIAFLIGGSIYGTYLNCILQGENIPISYSIISGLFVGIILSFVYHLLFHLPKMLYQLGVSKKMLTFINIIITIFLFMCLTLLTCCSKFFPITPIYVVVHIANYIVSTIAVVKANSDWRKSIM